MPKLVITSEQSDQLSEWSQEFGEAPDGAYMSMMEESIERHPLFKGLILAGQEPLDIYLAWAEQRNG